MWVVLALATLIIGGCQTFLRSPTTDPPLPERHQVRFEGETSRRVEKYEIPEGDAPLAFCVRIVLTAGTLNWHITNPLDLRISGTEGEIADEPYRATHCFEATPGTWQFEVALEGATGQYEVAWRELASAPDVADSLLSFDED